jgi:hypothetical protein
MTFPRPLPPPPIRPHPITSHDGPGDATFLDALRALAGRDVSCAYVHAEELVVSQSFQGFSFQNPSSTLDTAPLYPPQAGAPAEAVMVAGVKYYVGCNGFVDDADLVAAVLQDGLLAPTDSGELEAERRGILTRLKDAMKPHDLEHKVEAAANRSGQNSFFALEAGVGTLGEVRANAGRGGLTPPHIVQSFTGHDPCRGLSRRRPGLWCATTCVAWPWWR